MAQRCRSPGGVHRGRADGSVNLPLRSLLDERYKIEQAQSGALAQTWLP
ncbi:MAG: hypothetical protein AAFW95_00020 [Cyanobacteria bacterium J06638_6]